MTQFAYFNSAISGRSPVIGWYDTASIIYPALPATADLLEVTPTQWAARLTGQYAVSAGALVAYTPPAPTLTLVQQAAALLAGTRSAPPSVDLVLSGAISAITSPAPTGASVTAIFPIDAATVGRLAALNQAAAAGKLPSYKTTYDIIDTAGKWWHFTAVQAQAVIDEIYAYYDTLFDIAGSNPNAPSALPAASIPLTI